MIRMHKVVEKNQQLPNKTKLIELTDANNYSSNIKDNTASSSFGYNSSDSRTIKLSHKTTSLGQLKSAKHSDMVDYLNHDDNKRSSCYC